MRTEAKSPVEIEQFSLEPGMYFEGIGELNLIDSKWKLVIKLDISSLEQRQKQIKEWIERADSARDTIHPTRPERIKFTNLLGLIKKDDDRLTLLINRLYSIYSSTTDRKRGLINGIGSLAKTLFGTMDAEDEKLINEQVALIQNNQKNYRSCNS